MDEIKAIIIELESRKEKYLKFYLSFNKYWKNSNFLKFAGIGDNEILKRTNNTAEGYHRSFNTKIEAYHPKINYFVNKLKDITIENYNKYIKNQVLASKTEKRSYNIFSDIYKFIYKFSHQSNLTINFSVLKELLLKGEINNSEIFSNYLNLLYAKFLMVFFVFFYAFYYIYN